MGCEGVEKIHLILIRAHSWTWWWCMFDVHLKKCFVGYLYGGSASSSLRPESLTPALTGRPRPRVRKFGRKTISVFPTGANGNIGITGPGLSLGSGVLRFGERRRLAGTSAGRMLEVPAKRRSPRWATPNVPAISAPPPHPSSQPQPRSGIADIPVGTGRNYRNRFPQIFGAGV